MPRLAAVPRIHAVTLMVALSLASSACAQGRADGAAAADSGRVVRNVSPAMEPTLRAGADVRVTPFRDSTDAAGTVRRGDVVMYAWPPDTARKFLKRVVGLPGDTLAMARGVLRVNGTPVAEPHAWHADSAPPQAVPEMNWMHDFAVGGAARTGDATRNDWGPIVVPRSAWFVLGDNRDNSLDSRYWGFVSAAQLLGRASVAAPR